MLPRSIADVLRRRAREQPDHCAFVYLRDSGEPQASLTYAELDAQARRVADGITALAGGARDPRVVLTYPQSVDFIAGFFGALYAGAVAVPTPPLRSERDLPRILDVAADAQATIWMSSARLCDAHAPVVAALATSGMRVLVTDALAGDGSDPDRVLAGRESRLSHLQYTSGSTTRPRGVAISHANVLDNLRLIDADFRHDDRTVGVSWLPFFHDMGLVYGVLQPVFSGFPCYLFSPSAFVQRPMLWIETLSRYKGTHSGGPNFAYDACCDAVQRWNGTPCDLSEWCVAFNGAEPVRADTLRRFAAQFAPWGFSAASLCPSYGLAEATLKVTADIPGRAPRTLTVDARALQEHRIALRAAGARGTQEVVACGAVGVEPRVIVVHPDERRRCGPDEVGELWVRGDSVATGYWKRPRDTRETFRAVALDVSGSFLRTGDLGFIRDGELFVTGRRKECLIVGGRNYYPQDIEATVAATLAGTGAGSTVAFAVAGETGERLIIVQEGPRRVAEAFAATAPARIRAAVAQGHELPVHAVVLTPPRRIPRTTSGKLRRLACRDAFLAGTLEGVVDVVALERAEHTDAAPVRQRLRNMTAAAAEEEWAGHFRRLVASRLRISVEQIDDRRTPVELGLSSMSAAAVAADLACDPGVVVAASRLLDPVPLRELARECARLPCVEEPRTASTPSADVGPLSPEQLDLWLHYGLEPHSSAYIIARALRISGLVEVSGWRAALQRVVDAHPALRTTFSPSAPPTQRVHARIELPFEHGTVSKVDLWVSLREEASRPFDLTSGPVFRLRLWSVDVDEHYLLIAVHHIVADYRSLDLVVSTLLDEVEGLPGNVTKRRIAPLSFHQHVAARHESLASIAAEERSRRCCERLEPFPEVLSFTTDRVAAGGSSAPMVSASFSLPRATVDRLLDLGRAHGATLYTLMMLAFALLARRHSGQRRFLLGSPTLGRPDPRWLDTVGMFVNTMPVPVAFDGDPTTRQALQIVRDSVAASLADADVPFSHIVRQLGRPYVLGRAPLVQAMVVMYEALDASWPASAVMGLAQEAPPFRRGGLTLQPLGLRQGSMHHDVMLSIASCGDEVRAVLDARADLFEAATVELLSRQLVSILEALPDSLDTRIGDVALAEEPAAYHARCCGIARDRHGLLLHRMVEVQAARDPSAVAVVDGPRRLDFGELNARANRFARKLRLAGVGGDDIVGLAAERSCEAVVAMLGILKAGAAYMPLSPELPAQRLTAMCDAARTTVAVVDETLTSMPALPVRVLPLHRELRDAGGCGDLPCAGHPLQAAYVMFTSGSTGVPKGVVNTHAGIVNRIAAIQEQWPLTAADRVLQKTTSSFDVSVWECFWPLTAGATLYLARPGGHKDMAYLRRLIAEERITTVHFVPSALRAFLADPTVSTCATLRRVFCSGEEVTPDLVRLFRERFAADLFNLYGPTEAAVEVTAWQLPDGFAAPRVPIGRPIANVSIDIADGGRAQPPGVLGEILIGGCAVARGYLGQPGLTAERFVPDAVSRAAGARVYRTGDIGRYRYDGEIEFFGRRDGQVKIRGCRIELEEIETALRRHPALADAAVAVVRPPHAEPFLVAYVVARNGCPAATDLGAHLRQALPAYMVPRDFVAVGEMPRLSSGKIDRANLGRVAAAPLPATPSRRSPGTTIEQAVWSMWQDVLAFTEFGTDDDFVQLGGHSLAAAHVVARIRTEFGVDVPMADLLGGDATVARLAGRIAAAAAPAC